MMMRVFVMTSLFTACFAKLHLFQKPDTFALGVIYGQGPLWAVICKKTGHGDVPGYLNSHGEAFHPWGQKNNKCSDYEVVSGVLISSKFFKTSDCEARGYQTNDRDKYYNAVIPTKYGWIPGKANGTATSAWYYYDRREYRVNSFNDDFYMIC